MLKLNSPYVYVITEVSSGKKYIGCRTARDASPTELGNTYFTSSKYIKSKWKSDTASFVVDEIIVCSSKEAAYSLEESMQRDVVAHRNPEYLNKNINGKHFNVAGSKHNVGFRHSEESKRKMSIAHSGKKLSCNHKRKLSESRRGRRFSKDHCQKIGEAQVGNKRGANLYLFLSPDGVEYEVLGIKKFLKENSLPTLNTTSRFVNKGVIEGETNKHTQSLNGWKIDCLGLYSRL